MGLASCSAHPPASQARANHQGNRIHWHRRVTKSAENDELGLLFFSAAFVSLRCTFCFSGGHAANSRLTRKRADQKKFGTLVFSRVAATGDSLGRKSQVTFGHVKGAFTGAYADKKGRFEVANDGTLFLDEVGDMSPRLQVKLLRALQEQEFEKVGDTKTVKVDVRLIAATNIKIWRKRWRMEAFAKIYFSG